MSEPTIDPRWSALLAAESADDPTRTLRPAEATVAMSMPLVDAERTADELTAGELRDLEILALLGKGGMGRVMLARQRSLQREVAVKILAEEHRDSPAYVAALQSEARIAGGLDHPHVIPIHDAGRDFFVMRRVGGHTLSELLARGCSLEQVVEILRKVTDALAYAHDLGVIHRDVKPANIMVGDFGEVLLMDWGLATRFGSDGDGPPRAYLPDGAAAGGTPSYLAPEMARADARAIGPWSDVYLLGATLYRALTGKPPHRGDTAERVLAFASANLFKPIAELAPDAPTALAELATAAMATAGADRISLAGFRAGLQRWLQSQGDESMAAEHLYMARLLFDAATADPDGGYADLVEASGELARAEALFPSAPGLAELRIDLAREHCRRAVAKGDLALADRIATRSGDLPTREHVAEAWRRERERRRRALTARVGAGLVAAVVVVALAALAGWASDAGERAERHRGELADQAVAELRGLPTTGRAPLRRRLALAYRAIGLDPGPERREVLRRELLRQLRSDLADHDLAAATARFEQLHLVVGDDRRHLPEARALAALAADRPRQELVDDRRLRLQRIVEEVEEHSGGADWLTLRSEELSSWDGEELLPAIAALLDHPRPALRQLALRVLDRRGTPDVEQRILGALDDRNPAVVADARRLARRRDLPAAAAAWVAWIAAADDRWQARSRAIGLGPRLRTACLAALPDPSDHLPLLPPPEALDRYLADDADSAALEAGARLAWGQGEDPERCRAACRRLRARDPGNPWPSILEASLALEAGDPAAALAIVRDARVEPAQRHLLLPLHGRILLDLSRDGEAAVVAEALRDRPGDFGDLHFLAAAVARQALGDEAANALLARMPDRYQADRQAVRDAREHRSPSDAIALALLLAEHHHGHHGALYDAARTAWQARRWSRAEDLMARTLRWNGDRHTAAKLASAMTAPSAEPTLAIARAERAVASAHDHFCHPSYYQLLVAAERGEDRQRVIATCRVLAERGTPSLARSRALRSLLERGEGQLAVQLLVTGPELSAEGDARVRADLDLILLCHPALRETGWPGCRGGRLARALLREARVLLQHDRHARALAWIALARRALDPETDRCLQLAATLLQAAALGDHAGVRSACAALEALPAEQRARLPWSPALLLLDRAWAAGDGSGPLPARPVDPHRITSALHPAPLVDLRLDHDRWQALRAWLHANLPSLPPDPVAGVEALLAWRDDLAAGAWDGEPPAPATAPRRSWADALAGAPP